MHDVEGIHYLHQLPIATVNLFCNISDARETANCNFTGITHISENKCCKQL